MNTEATQTERRAACIFLCAEDGSIRAARGLIGRAIRSALGVTRWHAAPHNVEYQSTACCEGEAPRFQLDVSDAEMAALSATLDELAQAEGWMGSPADCYHN